MPGYSYNAALPPQQQNGYLQNLMFHPQSVGSVTQDRSQPYMQNIGLLDQGTKSNINVPIFNVHDFDTGVTGNRNGVNSTIGSFTQGLDTSKYGDFANMFNKSANYMPTFNSDGSLKSVGVKSGEFNRTDVQYTKQGDYYVPQSTSNAYWNTGKGFVKDTVSSMAPVLTLASMVIPALAPIAMAANAYNGVANHNYLGAAMSVLPGIGGLAGQGSQFADIAKGVGAAGQAYGGVKSIQNGNLLGGLAGLAGAAGAASGMSGNSDLGGMFGSAAKGLGIANNLQRGNIVGALSGGLNMGGYGQAAGALNMANSIYNLTQQRGTPMKQGPVRTVQPMMFGNPTARG
jgi:hypothetical protein